MNKIIKWAFYLFLISLPFGTRYLVYSFTPGFHEYESVWAYGTDILMAAFLISAAFFWRKGHSEGQGPEESYGNRFFALLRMTRVWLSLFLIVAFFSIFFAASIGLAIYSFLRLVLLVLMALAVNVALRQAQGIKLKNIFIILAGSAVFQALLGFGQFLKQASLGLRWLGEPVAEYGAIGPAKIIVEGAKILRPFGTFPHANIFGAFLVLGLICLVYLFIKHQQNPKLRIVSEPAYRQAGATNIFLVFGIFAVALGIVISFSRSAWIVGGLATLFFSIYFLAQKEYRRPALYLTIILFSTLYFLLSIFSAYILPRAGLLSSGKDVSVSDRVRYTQLGLNLIKENPLGVGNQVLYSVQNGEYLKLGMDKVWLWEPVHNLYLLIASEIGIFGVFTFLVFIISLLISNFQFLTMPTGRQVSNEFLNSKFEILTSLIMILSLLLLGLFDHYLWTIQQGRLMLWLTLGLLLGLNYPKSARSTTDRTHPSEG